MQWCKVHYSVLQCLLFKQVKLSPPKAAATNSCLNKLINQFSAYHKTRCDPVTQGTQFHSPSWKSHLESHNVQVRNTAVSYPQSKTSERDTKEISKFFGYTVVTTTRYRHTLLLLQYFVGKGLPVFEEVIPEMPEGTCIRRLGDKNRKSLWKEKQNKGQCTL